MPAVSSRVLSPRAPDEAHPHAHGGEAPRMHFSQVSFPPQCPRRRSSAGTGRGVREGIEQVLTESWGPCSCDKRFSRSDELTRHVRIHQTDRGRKKAASAAASRTNSPRTSPGISAKDAAERASRAAAVNVAKSESVSASEDVSGSLPVGSGRTRADAHGIYRARARRNHRTTRVMARL